VPGDAETILTLPIAAWPVDAAVLPRQIPVISTAAQNTLATRRQDMAENEIPATGHRAAAREKKESSCDCVCVAAAADIYETDEELVVLLDMPGVSGGRGDFRVGIPGKLW